MRVISSHSKKSLAFKLPYLLRAGDAQVPVRAGRHLLRTGQRYFVACFQVSKNFDKSALVRPVKQAMLSSRLISLFQE